MNPQRPFLLIPRNNDTVITKTRQSDWLAVDFVTFTCLAELSTIPSSSQDHRIPGLIVHQ